MYKKHITATTKKLKSMLNLKMIIGKAIQVFITYTIIIIIVISIHTYLLTSVTSVKYFLICVVWCFGSIGILRCMSYVHKALFLLLYSCNNNKKTFVLAVITEVHLTFKR